MKILLIALMALPFSLVADEKQQKVYDGIMSDSDLYSGEGVVTLKSFGEDITKAKASGRERARANMVESIRVRIVSKTTDTQSAGKDGDKEEISSESSSSADLELEGIQYKYLEGMPKAGQMTVLSYLSKEEYQRQSDKRILGYRPLRALRLWGGVLISQAMEDLFEKNSNPPTGQPVGMQSGQDSGQSSISFGGDFYWSSYLLGLGVTSGRKNFYAWEQRQGLYTNRNNPYSILHVKVGYEWTPWASRFQVAVPIQAEFDYLNFDPWFATGYAVASGLRLRYWVTDRVAFDAGGLYHLGLSKNEITTGSGEALLVGFPRTAAVLDPSGPEATLGIIWNGF